jgi:hypothetical protein
MTTKPVVRKCKTCGRTEKQVYLSAHRSCKKCAIAAATAQAERAFEVARKAGHGDGLSFDARVRRGVAFNRAMHADAVKRRPVKKVPASG